MLSEEDRLRSVYETRKAREDAKIGLYSLFNRGQLYMLQELERALLALFREINIGSLATKTILDIGCGSGYWIREFLKLGATPENLVGIDLMDWRIGAARRTCPASVRLESGNAENVRYSDQSFDLIVQFTVFSSILDPNMKRKVAAEMLRVLKEDGFIIWYDFFVGNPRNNDVRGIKKQEIQQLFSGCQIQLQRVTLAPPIVRLIAPYSWMLCYVLEKVKILDTHYLGLIRKLPV